MKYYCISTMLPNGIHWLLYISIKTSGRLLHKVQLLQQHKIHFGIVASVYATSTEWVSRYKS